MASSTQTVISKLKILCVSSPRLYFNYWRINVYSSTCLRDFYGKNFSQKKWIHIQNAPINIVSKNLFEKFAFFMRNVITVKKTIIINFSRMKSIHVLMWASSPWPMWCTLWCMAGEWGHVLVYFLADNVWSKSKLSPRRVKQWSVLLLIL